MSGTRKEWKEDVSNKAGHFLLVKKYWKEVSVAKYQAELETEQQNKKNTAKGS